MADAVNEVLSTSPVNGSGTIGAPEPLPSQSEIDLMSLSQRFALLENRIVKIEVEQARFTNALMYAGKFIMQNPASKMILMSLPKEIKTKLEEFFNGQT